MYRGEVRVVVDEQDDLFSTQVALEAHRPAEGCLTVQPTPASALPAALAHDVLYALGKRLAPASSRADVPLDSEKEAWLAAAAWCIAGGIRHVVLLRAHLLTTHRLEQLLAWRDMTGIQLTLVWQAAPRGMPPELARPMHRVSRREQFEAMLAEQEPVPACPAYSPAPGRAVAGAARHQTRPARAGQTDEGCSSAAATTVLAEAVPPAENTPENTAALATLAHPLIAGGLSVPAFAHRPLGALRWIRDQDLTADVSVLKTHTPDHRQCRLHAVPAWARPLLAAARAHHRLAPSPGGHVFAPLFPSEARHLRAHARRLAKTGLPLAGSFLAC